MKRILFPILLFLSSVSTAIFSQSHPSSAMPSRANHNIARRLLVIEAEDLGMSHSIDKASFDALEKGWLTSAGILVPAPWFPEVVRWARNHPDEDFGIQLDLNAEWASYRWSPISLQPLGSGLRDSAGYLPNSLTYVVEHAKREDIAIEFYAQTEAAKSAGLPISHLGSHGTTVLYTPSLFEEYCSVSKKTEIPPALSKEWVRQRGKPTVQTNIYEVGSVRVDLADVPFDRVFEMRPDVAKANWLSTYEDMLTNLSPGTYLLEVHLGYDGEELRAMTVDHPNWGAQWRQNDYDVISSAEFHEFLKEQGFILVSWKELRSGPGYAAATVCK